MQLVKATQTVKYIFSLALKGGTNLKYSKGVEIFAFLGVSTQSTIQSFEKTQQMDKWMSWGNICELGWFLGTRYAAIEYYPSIRRVFK